MSKAIRLVPVLAIAAAALSLGACRGDSGKQGASALAADSSLAHDLALANADSASRPQLSDVPKAPPAPVAPRKREPRPAREQAPAAAAPVPVETAPPLPIPVPVPVPDSTVPTTTASGNTVTSNAAGSGAANQGGNVGTIASGTSFPLTAATKVCTDSNAVGDHLSATLASPITGSNGATVPAGATVILTATQLKPSTNVNDPIRMQFQVSSLTYGGKTYTLTGSVVSADVTRVRDTPKKTDAEKVAGGAVVGALLGQLFGHNTKGTVIGAAAGAAAGAGAAAATGTYAGCINPGAKITVRLDAPVDVIVSS